MGYFHLKKTSVFLLCFSIFLSHNASSQKSFSTGESIFLTFKVLSWQTQDVIEIKYSGSVPTERIKNDMEALAKAHGWRYSENSFEVTYENSDKIGQQCGEFSEKHRFFTNFTLNFQNIREQFQDFETIIIDLIGSNGFTYQGNFSTSPDTNENTDLLDQNWQDQLPFRKDWMGMSNYRIRYVLQPSTLNFPILRATASFSKMWLLKTAPLLVFFIFMPSGFLYLLIQQGVSRNESGRIKLSPVKLIIINIQFPLMIWVVAVIGCADVTAMLTQNRILGGILGIATVPILSYVIFVFVLHKHEKNIRNTTWSFRENLLTNLRMIILGSPLLLLPFCYFGTQKSFPELPFLIFLALLLCQYALLTSLFGCVIPFAMSWIWKGKPLADDTLRQRLQQLAEKAGINYRDLVLLQTKSSKLANAWVAGILPKWRSVFVTDHLLEHLSSNEIETIFAHELGHLKHKHLLKQVAWIVLGFGGQLALIRLSLFLFGFFTGIPAWLYWLLFASVNFGVILLLVQFGLMQFWRRMEFEADAYAIELTQQPSVFLQALRKLIELNDAPEDLDKFNEMLSTHPNFKARAAAIKKNRYHPNNKHVKNFEKP